MVKGTQRGCRMVSNESVTDVVARKGSVDSAVGQLACSASESDLFEGRSDTLTTYLFRFYASLRLANEDRRSLISALQRSTTPEGYFSNNKTPFQEAHTGSAQCCSLVRRGKRKHRSRAQRVQLRGDVQRMEPTSSQCLKQRHQYICVGELRF